MGLIEKFVAGRRPKTLVGDSNGSDRRQIPGDYQEIPGIRQPQSRDSAVAIAVVTDRCRDELGRNQTDPWGVGVRQGPNQQRIPFSDALTEEYQGRQNIQALQHHEDRQRFRSGPDRGGQGPIIDVVEI